MRRLSNDVEALEDVVVIECGKCLDLAVEHFATDGIFDSFHVDGFDGDDFIWSKKKITGEIIGAFVDNGWESFSDFVVVAVGEVFDFFTGVSGDAEGRDGFFVVVGEVGGH